MRQSLLRRPNISAERPLRPTFRRPVQGGKARSLISGNSRPGPRLHSQGRKGEDSFVARRSGPIAMAVGVRSSQFPLTPAGWPGGRAVLGWLRPSFSTETALGTRRDPEVVSQTGSGTGLGPSVADLLRRQADADPASRPNPVGTPALAPCPPQTAFSTGAIPNVTQKRRFWTAFGQTSVGNAVSGPRLEKRALETRFPIRVFTNATQKRSFWMTFGQPWSGNGVSMIVFGRFLPAIPVGGPPLAPMAPPTARPDAPPGPPPRRCRRRWPRLGRSPGPSRFRAAAGPNPLCLSLNIRRSTILESLSTNLGYFLTGLWPHISPIHQP